MDKIGIIGFGFVGQAVYSSIRNTASVSVYDKFKPMHQDIESLLGSDYIFICVPTQTGKKGLQDDSAFEETMMLLNEKKYEGICIVKSTVLPDSIMRWEEKISIVSNPEFLNQNSANEDFKNQKFVILGGDAVDCCEVKEMYEDAFDLKVEYLITSIQESMEFKYIHNIYHAYNVLFWNYVQENFGNSRKHVSLYEKIYNRKPILSQIAPDGKLGYGGACFPKDVKAMNCNKHHELTEFMIKFNNRLRK